MKRKTCTKCRKRKPESSFYIRDKKTGRRNTQCVECVRSRISTRQKKLKKARKCFHCAKPLAKEDVTMCALCKAKRRAEYHADGDRRRAVSRKRARDLKLAAFEAYGGCICLCCGETESKFLSIDHVNGDGAAHRKKLGPTHANGKGFYTWLKKNDYPPGYQVLCFNCNFAKGHYGICPHQETAKEKRG